MIPKRHSAYRIEVWENDMRIDTFYVRPQHAKFWMSPHWWDDEQRFYLHACHVSSARFKKLFPRSVTHTEAW